MPKVRSLLKAKGTGATPPTDPLPLVVGLRNPGAEYEGTRHNSGYEVVSRVLDRHGARLGRAPTRVRAQIARVLAGGGGFLVAVPVTYMNDSGRAVRSLLDYFGLSTDEMLVVHDDIDLPFGRLRVQIDGGSGGNNGVRSIERALGTNQFSRLKVGVGRPPGDMDPADFVLRQFSKTERGEVGLIFEDAADVVEQWLSDPAKAQERAALRGREKT